MEIKVKRTDKNIPLPEHKTSSSAAIDLHSSEDITVEPGELAYIPLNIAMEIPKGYFGMLVSRSSTHKLGITSINGVGILDSDFCGDDDIPHFIAINYTKKTVHIKKGTRVSQLLVVKHENISITEVDSLNNKNRGGIGSTGNR